MHNPMSVCHPHNWWQKRPDFPKAYFIFNNGASSSNLLYETYGSIDLSSSYKLQIRKNTPVC
jgi:hypothetical protein